MSKTIYLLRYNNYFNRTIKRLNTLGEYAQQATICGIISNMTLWNPNDGVDTQITTPLQLTAIPDYMIEVQTTEANAIVSRWFVIEAVRITKGQYRLRLHRDLIADNLDTVLTNPNTYVERGWVSTSDDEIYNLEPFTFDEIKKNQTPLYDRSQCPWVVIYLAPNSSTATSEAFPDGSYPIRYGGALSVQLDYAGLGDAVGGTKIGTVEDAPYAILALPYGGALQQILTDGTKGTIMTKDLAVEIARGLSVALSGGGWMMDAQLVPFCPCPEVLVENDGSLEIDLSKAYAYAPLVASGVTIGGLIACQSANFTAPIMKSIYTPLEIEVEDIKVETNARFYRLTSPNFNGTFQFDPAKMVYANGQTVALTAYCTYIPYQPYIRIAPNYDRLYGGEYKDPRGLICAGDLSLPQISDAWTTYQIQNKNYQAIFDRQVKSMDLQHSIANVQDMVSAFTGTIGGVTGGTATGALAGGGVGAIIGGVAGGAASLVGGVADISYNRQLRADQRSLTIKQHNMELQNIKALPQSVSNMSTVNIDSPGTAVLEMYEGSEQQITNFKEYLAQYGYTINKVATLESCCQANTQTYLRGQIVRIDLPDDAHFVGALADEVSQGFYYTKEV